MSVAICMWSGPRNLSTAMMRSFDARSDCYVWDEPFFAPYLYVTGKAHPGRDETLASHETDPLKIAAQCQAQIKSSYHFQKHMPHHMIEGFPMHWTQGAKHFFLLREPRRVMASYIKGRGVFDVEDLGFAAQLRIFKYLTDENGTPPLVIDSLDILKNPKRALTALCAGINIPFEKAMLSWKSGTRVTDGAWAPYWYKSVEASRGFNPPPDRGANVNLSIPETYKNMLAACERDYEILSDHKLRF